MGDNRDNGLTTEEALRKLYEAIDDQLLECECQSKGMESLKYLLIKSFNHSSITSTFRWPSIVVLLCTTIIYYIAYVYGHFTSSIPLFMEATLLLLILLFNITLTYWDTKSRHMEIYRKAKLLSQQIKSCHNNSQLIEYWKTLRYYPHLNTPQSPCISLQWTFRDGKRVNLPIPLLVAGDVILLSPGRSAPAKCRNIEAISHSNNVHVYTSESNSDYNLNCGELFVPSVDYASESFTIPRLRRAVKPVKFVILETPFVVDLRTAISKEHTRKLATAFEKELHLIFVKYIEQILIPIIWVGVMLFSAIHYGYLESIGNETVTWPASLTLLLLRPVMAILPLLPLTLPLSWLMLNVYGLSHLFQVCASNYDKQDITNIQGSPGSILTGSNIGRAKDEYFKSSNNKDFYIEELDSDRSNVPLINSKLSCLDMIFKMKALLSSNDTNLWRTANLLHVLGSITALCCVDKKGILSWPNPTVDKVFFVTSHKDNKPNKNHNKDSDSDTDDTDSETKETKEKRAHKSSLYPYSRAECIQLDITHDPHNAYGLQFDDTEWQKYLFNLKPLGLAILLNTCNQEAQEEFIQFCDHVACESLHNEAAVPVVNKRCLCELARQIGFTENAVKGYEYNHQIAMFRHVRPEVIQKGKLAKSLNFPRLKMPFPNMTCAVIKDIYSSTFQLFSQGTGDLVLDACTEYWDGHDLCVLTDSDRKKILDFYHRSSLTSYCSAFSYVPLHSIQETITLNDCYIELPPDSSHLFPSQKSLDSSLRFSEHHNHLQVLTDLSTKNAILNHHLSSDSLVKQEVFDLNRANRPKSSASSTSIDNHQIEYLMHQMSNEVFIGMTTMQYQACSDFVHLVEQLETACIRFVHFSKENELRSRVFSEKMGLESGWNCHISLLNDDNHTESNCGTTSSFYHHSNASKGSKSSLIHESQTITINTVCRSQSAPGSVNLEISTVKFADDCDIESSSETDSNRDNESQQDLNSNADNERSSERSNESRRMSKATSNLSPSPSRITTSTGTENSAPIAFDMSNRAKLPKGIENIRPHLENVDNVPLLVSLFTDCVPEATKEMIAIMQEYGEVVCVVGSSANMLNMPVFLLADASIGVEPMYPQVCITEPIKEADGFIESLPDNFIGPTDLARQLITLSCSLSIYRQNSIIFYQLIMEARHYMMKMRNSFQFLISSCLSLSLAQLLSSLLFLPPLLSPGVVLWLTCIVIPILSSSLMGTEVDDEVMSVATGKKLLHLNRESILYFFVCYLLKFAPSVFISVICFGLIIGHSCQDIKIGFSTAGPCWMFSDVKANGDIKTDLLWSSHLLIGQTVASLFLVLYIIIISIGFVHRNYLIWQRSPLINKWWIFISITLLMSHAVLCIIEISIYVPSAETAKQFISSIPIYVWCLGFLWPFILISINTLTKRHEIKVNSRQQRRARLEFGTKLGMNSPF